jgi:hypothetical protein
MLKKETIRRKEARMSGTITTTRPGHELPAVFVVPAFNSTAARAI